MEKTDFKGIAILILTVTGIGGLVILIHLATSEENKVAIAILSAMSFGFAIIIGVVIALLAIMTVAKKDQAQFEANANKNVRLMQEAQKLQNLQHRQLMADNKDIREEQKHQRRQIEPPTVEPDAFEFAEGIFEELDTEV